MGCWICKDHSLTLGVMAQCYCPCLELGPQKGFWGSNPRVCRWKLCQPSATDLDLGVTTACWSGLQLCFKIIIRLKLVVDVTLWSFFSLGVYWTKHLPYYIVCVDGAKNPRTFHHHYVFLDVFLVWYCWTFVVISLFLIKCHFIDFGNIIAVLCQCINAAN